MRLHHLRIVRRLGIRNNLSRHLCHFILVFPPITLSRFARNSLSRLRGHCLHSLHLHRLSLLRHIPVQIRLIMCMKGSSATSLFLLFHGRIKISSATMVHSDSRPTVRSVPRFVLCRHRFSEAPRLTRMIRSSSALHFVLFCYSLGLGFDQHYFVQRVVYILLTFIEFTFALVIMHCYHTWRSGSCCR